MNIKCLLVGHKFSIYPNEVDCKRCGKMLFDLHQTIPGLMYVVKIRIKHSGPMRKLRKFLHWLKCSDCGERFGKHDKYCPPF